MLRTFGRCERGREGVEKVGWGFWKVEVEVEQREGGVSIQRFLAQLSYLGCNRIGCEKEKREKKFGKRKNGDEDRR